MDSSTDLPVSTNNAKYAFDLGTNTLIELSSWHFKLAMSVIVGLLCIFLMLYLYDKYIASKNKDV